MAGDIGDWSKTASSNANSDGDINWNEGQQPSTVNNSARQMMGRVAEWRDDLGGVVTVGGTANAITVTANSNFTAYASGRKMTFKAASTNSGAATLNVNAIGAKSIRRFGSGGEQPLMAGDIQANSRYDVIYDTAVNGGSGGWILLNPSQPFRPAFRAHRNGVNQNPIAANTYTKFVPTTEDFDVGSAFNLSNSRWTPPAGPVNLTAVALFSGSQLSAGDLIFSAIYKNGTLFSVVNTMIVLTGINTSVINSTDDQANGTDYYEMFVRCDGNIGVLNGVASVTYFSGQAG